MHAPDSHKQRIHPNNETNLRSPLPSSKPLSARTRLFPALETVKNEPNSPFVFNAACPTLLP